MIPRNRLPLLALALLAAPAMAQQSPNDFQLPPAPTPTPTSNAQGPVDTEGPVPVRPRAIPTATPTRRPPIVLPPETTASTQTPAPSTRQTQPAAIPRETPSNRQVPAAPPLARPTTAPTQRETPGDDALPEASAATPAVPSNGAILPAPSSPGETTAELDTGPDEPGDWIGWALALAALGAGALGAGYALRRRRARTSVPLIEKPRVEPVASPPAHGALFLRVEALRMSRSFMNATLSYRVTVLNRSTSSLSAVAVEADLASAHGDLPMESQVAEAGTALEERHAAQRLAAGQSARFEGQVVLPLSSARLIRQGQVALLVPLLRLRARAAGIEPVAKTFAIGPAAAGGGTRLVPFRLDDGPRSYEPLAQLAID